MCQLCGASKIAAGLRRAGRSISKGNPPSVPVVAEFVTPATNSATTGTDGGFHFEIDLAAGERADAILSVHKNGYINRTVALGVSQDTTIDVGLTVDLSTSATIIGVVRDSVTLYPLRNTNIL